MIRITCTNGEYFDIGIVDYEYPDSADRIYDGNWLRIYLNLHSQRGDLKTTDPALLTWEVEALINWLRDIRAGGHITHDPLRFTEPNLEVELIDGAEHEGRWYVRFHFRLEFRPAHIPDDEDFALTAELSAADIDRIVTELERELKVHPKRLPEPQEIRSLKRKARVVLALFTAGLVLAGLSALPIQTGIEFLQQLVGEGSPTEGWWPGLAAWISHVHHGVTTAGRAYPFFFYGTDWLAFGHFVIAFMFLGALRDPVKNIWIIEAGLVACALVVPWALLFGPLRGIPFFWRLIDCSFGVGGLLPLVLARRYVRQIIELQQQQGPAA